MNPEPMRPDEATPIRAGMVAVVGRANVGKSTLVNRALGEKVSIVSPVAQTTRNLIRAILTEPRGQMVFLDTPGVHKAQSDLGKVMNRIARASIEGVDAVLLVLDTSRAPRLEDEGWMRRLAHEDIPVLIVVNKTDMEEDHDAEYRELWGRIVDEKGGHREPEWRRVSATTGDGVDPLLDRMFELAPEGPLLFPEDVLTDFPRKLTIADIIREKYFHCLEQELPHSMAIWIETIEEAEDRWNVSGVIYVNRHSQKGIVIGERGRLLRRIRRSAEQELSDLYEVRVRLHLRVKVEKNWSRNYWLLRNMGLA